jgi:ADP-heptose:LPS heptosyltransferase
LAETSPEAATAFFRDIVEPLSDRFERAAVDEYARLLKDVAGCDFWRFQRIRQPRPCIVEAADVVVLSRVTLGADVAVTSVILDAAKKRFASARLWFAGPRKNYELFAGDPAVRHLTVDYPRRGSLRERIDVARNLKLPDRAVVIDPDSRITQLGLVPVCLERDYYFFESRSYGESSSLALPQLTSEWCRETFGIRDARAYVAPLSSTPGADIAVSLGVGGNRSKRLDAAFERGLLERLTAAGEVLIDRGAGGEEADRVNRATEGLSVRYAEGSFAEFAGGIVRSRRYVGYDSAGQHVAAAAGIPLTVYFTGAGNARFRQRWRPWGPGAIEVVDV